VLKKRKGDTEFLHVPIGVALAIGILIALVVFVQASVLKFSGDLKVVEKDLQAIDAAHIIKDCFSDMSGSIPSSFLENKDNQKKGLCLLCGICGVTVGAKIEYLEGPDKWKPYYFGYDGTGSTHKIFVSVSVGDKTYVSRLTASVK
jgi:hypothetical protein